MRKLKFVTASALPLPKHKYCAAQMRESRQEVLILEAFKWGCMRRLAVKLSFSVIVVATLPEGKTTESIFEHSIHWVAGGPGILRQLSTSRKAPAHEKANRWIGALHWLPLRIIAVLGQMRQSQAAQGSKKLLLDRSTQLGERRRSSLPLPLSVYSSFH